MDKTESKAIQLGFVTFFPVETKMHPVSHKVFMAKVCLVDTLFSGTFIDTVDLNLPMSIKVPLPQLLQSV